MRLSTRLRRSEKGEEPVLFLPNPRLNKSARTKKAGQGGRKFRVRPVIFRAKIFKRRFLSEDKEETKKKGRKKTETRATTYSPAKRIAVPSAREGLTAGFGMGPGGPPPLLSPVSLFYPTSAAVADASASGAKAKSFRCSSFRCSSSRTARN